MELLHKIFQQCLQLLKAMTLKIIYSEKEIEAPIICYVEV